MDILQEKNFWFKNTEIQDEEIASLIKLVQKLPNRQYELCNYCLVVLVIISFSFSLLVGRYLIGAALSGVAGYVGY